MEKDIKFYYNLDVKIIDSKDDYYLIFDENNYYFYMKCKREDNEIKDIMKICLELQNKGIMTDQIIPNIQNSYISNGFILLKIKYFLNDEMTLDDLLKYNKQLIINRSYVNYWQTLWTTNVDYLESRFKDIKEKRIIQSSFDYYIGLAENAIIMLNKINKKYSNDTVLVLSRNRIKYPLYCKDYFNPLLFIFDSRVRDIAGYLKSKFFNGQDIIPNLDTIFKEKFSVYEYNLFYVRMLYPSYYFDILERILDNKEKEDKLIPIIDKVNEYEDFLKYLYVYMSKYCSIENLDWLNKKK